MHISKINVSIIIVYYKAKKELFNCLSSIKDSHQRVTYEVIVVDNDEEKTIEDELKKIFPWVLYRKSEGNVGFGAGNNIGAKYARGKFLFFLNPDTLIEKWAIDKLCHFLKKHDNVGVVAPLLLDENRKPYQLQGSTELRPLEGIVCLSFLNSLFPNNPISKKYFLKGWDKKNIKEVDVVPGTAFMIRRVVFEKAGEFDENFFLFFEESDLCKRVKKLGYKIFILPYCKVIHLWGRSTQYRSDIETIFAKSRFKYFRKHYGYISALLVEFFLRINKLTLLLSAILMLALFLRLYRLNELMPFIGDGGWFYLSARDMLLTGKIPLVGPETSHPWIHHGPLWTYELAIILWLFNFNPVPPAYFIAILGVITVWLIYKVASLLFSERVGIISAFLYATSPLIVLNARIPYHTSLIPFFTLLLVYGAYKWLHGNVKYVPLIFFLLAILYNHELTSFVFFIPIVILAIYGFWKRKMWATDLLNRKIITFSFFAFLIPMIPFIIYDIGHGYKQTVGFLVWIIYRIVKLPFGVLSSSYVFPKEFFSHFQRLLFTPNLIISLIIFVASFSYFAFILIKKLKSRTLDTASLLLFLFVFIPLLGIFIHREPIEADTLIVSPFSILAVSVLFDELMGVGFLKSLSIILVAFLAFANSFFLLSHYLTAKNKNQMTFSKQLQAANSVIRMTQGRNYNLIGKGVLDNFPVFTMPYEYLLWWKGHPPKKENVDLKIVVWEKDGEIIVYKQK